MTFRFRMDWPLALSIVLCIFSCWFDGIMQVLTERRSKGSKNTEPLPDLFHDWLPFVGWPKLNDIYLLAFAVFVFSRFAFAKSLRWKMLRRFLFLEGLILFLRGVSIVLTTLTVPLPHCKSDVTGNLFMESIYVFIYVHHTCADLLFSGHTATYVLLTLFFTHYSRGQEWRLCGINCSSVPLGAPSEDEVGDPSGCHWSSLFVWVGCAVGLFFILLTRFHYSCDVFIAFCLTSLAFHLYHYYVKSCLEQKTINAKFFRWFESISPYVVDNQTTSQSTFQSSSQQDVHVPSIPYPHVSKHHHDQPFHHSSQSSINPSINQTMLSSIPSRAINYRVSMLDGLAPGPFYHDEEGHPLSPRTAQIEDARRAQLIVAGEALDDQPINRTRQQSINPTAHQSAISHVADILRE